MVKKKNDGDDASKRAKNKAVTKTVKAAPKATRTEARPPNASTRTTPPPEPKVVREEPPVERAPQKTRREKPFKKAEMEQFRELLLRRRARLTGDLDLMHGEALRATDDDVSTDHMADYGSDRYEQDFTLGLIENEEEIVRHIDAALERIDSGEFGICEVCSGDIGVPRLQAIPYVKLCIDCQRRSEAG
jgi:RNA polymerase-binding protein DksA